MVDNIVYGTLESYLEGSFYTQGETTWEEHIISDLYPDMSTRNSVDDAISNIISILKFSTPAFLGTSQYLKFIFEGTQRNASPANLRFSLCTSSINKDAYTTSFNPPDPYRVDNADVSVYLANMGAGYGETFTVQFNTNKIKPNTTYYLVFQIMNTPTLNQGISRASIIDMVNYATIEIGYNSGIVYIENGASFDTYQYFIDSGATFEPYQLYIDTGTSWEPL